MSNVEHTETDEGQIESVRSGDLDAFGILMERHRQTVYGLCLRISGNVPQARELAHDPFPDPFPGVVLAIQRTGTSAATNSTSVRNVAS